MVNVMPLRKIKKQVEIREIKEKKTLTERISRIRRFDGIENS